MGRMDRTVVRKLDMNSPDFKEANMCLCEGSPQECWDEFWELARVVTVFSQDGYDFSKPIRRDVTEKTHRYLGANA
jgi:hypothetical protein